MIKFTARSVLINRNEIRNNLMYPARAAALSSSSPAAYMCESFQGVSARRPCPHAQILSSTKGNQASPELGGVGWPQQPKAAATTKLSHLTRARLTPHPLPSFRAVSWQSAHTAVKVAPSYTRGRKGFCKALQSQVECWKLEVTHAFFMHGVWVGGGPHLL